MTQMGTEVEFLENYFWVQKTFVWDLGYLDFLSYVRFYCYTWWVREGPGGGMVYVVWCMVYGT